MMKKRILLLLAAALLLCSLTVAANAKSEMPHVVDMYGLLTPSQVASLEQQAADLTAATGCGMYIVVLDDYREYASDTFRLCTELFETNDLGEGPDHLGTMLLLSMRDRDYELFYYGDSDCRIFTERERDDIEDAFLDDFRNSDFYTGFVDYLYASEQCFYREDSSGGFSILFFLPGLFAAFITGAVLQAPMHTAKQKRDADLYIAQGSVQLRRQSDVFLHRTVNRQPRQTKSSSSGSHGTSHTSGSSSGRSGKF